MSRHIVEIGYRCPKCQKHYRTPMERLESRSVCYHFSRGEPGYGTSGCCHVGEIEVRSELEMIDIWEHTHK